jgi:hypothetical protein
LTDYDVDKLYQLKGEIIRRGVKAITGFDMPVFPKRRFPAWRGARGTPQGRTVSTRAGLPPAFPRALQLNSPRRQASRPAVELGFQPGGMGRQNMSSLDMRETTPVAGDFCGRLEAALDGSQDGCRPEPARLPASILPERGLSAWIVAQRPPRAASDPFKPHAFFQETERGSSGRIVGSAVILLTNKECPWRCLMCDLWRHSLTRTVPLGAIPQQIDYALARLGARPEQLKLYNSGSFFDPGAIPPADYAAIARCVSFAGHVVVESHPRLVGDQARAFHDLLSGTLEVAMGLETVHPQVLPKLNKHCQPAHFARAAEFLLRAGIAVRAFVLVKPPFMSEAEGLEWAVKSARFAFDCGAAGGIAHPHSLRQRRFGPAAGVGRVHAAAPRHPGGSAGTGLEPACGKGLCGHLEPAGVFPPAPPAWSRDGSGCTP